MSISAREQWCGRCGRETAHWKSYAPAPDWDEAPPHVHLGVALRNLVALALPWNCSACLGPPSEADSTRLPAGADPLWDDEVDVPEIRFLETHIP